MIRNYWKMLANARGLDTWLTAKISWGEDGGLLLKWGAEAFVYFPDILARRLWKGSAVDGMIFQNSVKQGEVRSGVTLQNGLTIGWLSGGQKYSSEQTSLFAVFVPVNDRGGFERMCTFQIVGHRHTGVMTNRSAPEHKPHFINLNKGNLWHLHVDRPKRSPIQIST